MQPQSYDQYDQISMWISKFKGQRYLHIQQKPYSGENNKGRYVFLPIECVHLLMEKLDTIITDGMCPDEPINLQNDYQVLLMFKEPRTWQLKLIHASLQSKTLSQIDIVDLPSFSKALKTLK